VRRRPWRRGGDPRAGRRGAGDLHDHQFRDHQPPQDRRSHRTGKASGRVAETGEATAGASGLARYADGLGTLFIPNALAIIRGGPNPGAARWLVDYLVAPAVEAKLAAGPSAQIPLNLEVTAEVRVETPHTVKPMPVDSTAHE